MAQYFRIKEISAPATVLRQGNLLSIELGDFIYPDEVDTLVCTSTVVYWDDNTGEHFTKEAATAPVPVKTKVAPVAPAPAPVEETAEVVPAPLETGSEDTKA